MRFLISFLVAAHVAPVVRADYTCVFPLYCQTDASCETRAPMLVELRLGAEGWRMTEKFRGVDLAARSHPDADTSFANIFLVLDGTEHGLEAGQLSIDRSGQAIYTVHALGDRHDSRTHIGSCKSEESGTVSE